VIKFFSHGGIGDPHSGGTGAPRQWTPSPVLVARNYSASNILSLRAPKVRSNLLMLTDCFVAMTHLNTFWTAPLDFFLLQKKVKKIHDRKKMLNLVKQELL